MSTPAIAAVKAGATCSAKGQVKISSGYKIDGWKVSALEEGVEGVLIKVEKVS